MFPRINFAGKVEFYPATMNNIFNNFDINTFAPADTKINQRNWNPSGSNNFRLVDVAVTRVCHNEGLCVYQSHNDPLAGAPVKGTLFKYGFEIWYYRVIHKMLCRLSIPSTRFWGDGWH
jgi:hypothetical protein